MGGRGEAGAVGNGSVVRLRDSAGTRVESGGMMRAELGANAISVGMAPGTATTVTVGSAAPWSRGAFLRVRRMGWGGRRGVDASSLEPVQAEPSSTSSRESSPGTARRVGRAPGGARFNRVSGMAARPVEPSQEASVPGLTPGPGEVDDAAADGDRGGGGEADDAEAEGAAAEGSAVPGASAPADPAATGAPAPG